MYTIERNPRPGDDPHDPYAGLHFNPPLGSWELQVALEAAYPTVLVHSKRLQAAVQEFHLEQAKQVLARATAALATHGSSEFGTVGTNALQSPPVSASRSTLIDSETLSTMRNGMNVWRLPGTHIPRQRKKRRMNEQERSEYGDTRIIGACRNCKDRKKKV